MVLRDEGVMGSKDEELMDIMDVELMKKPGKGLGLSIVGRKNGPGIFISDVVSTNSKLTGFCPSYFLCICLTNLWDQ